MALQPGTANERDTTYGYDNANRLQTITSNTGTFTYGYDSLSRRTSLAYPNQIAAAYTYDGNSRLTSLGYSVGGSTIASFAYSLDKVGNRLSKSGTVNETYGYDPTYRLLQVTMPNGTENFTYDAVGNRLTGPGPQDTKYQYNAGNQVTTGKTFGHSYDGNGNQISRTVPNTTGKGWTATWDYENRLVRMTQTRSADNRTVTFAYDPNGRRIQKQLTSTINGVATTSTWQYFYDNDNIVYEIYTSGTGTTENTWYTHGAGTDEHLALERNGSYYYYLADGLGSVTTITDSSRNVAQSYAYDSFGMPKPQTAFRNSYTYTGREWDEETGLYYYRARYYDPMEGRFVSKDPISFRGGDVNLYGYAKENPINNTDSSGLSTQSQRSKCQAEADGMYNKCVAAIDKIDKGNTLYCVLKGIGAGIATGVAVTPGAGLATGAVLICGCFAPDPFDFVFQASKANCGQVRQRVFDACMAAPE